MGSPPQDLNRTRWSRTFNLSGENWQCSQYSSLDPKTKVIFQNRICFSHRVVLICFYLCFCNGGCYLSLSLSIYIYTNVGSQPWTVIRTRWSRVVNTSCENSHCCQDASLHQKTKKWFVKTEYVIYIELCWSVLIHDSALVALSLPLSLYVYMHIHIIYMYIYAHTYIWYIHTFQLLCRYTQPISEYASRHM